MNEVALTEPPVLPDWITPELITETIAIWQPRYSKRLTDQEAIEILRTVGQLFDALGDANDETVSSPGERLKP